MPCFCPGAEDRPEARAVAAGTGGGVRQQAEGVQTAEGLLELQEALRHPAEHRLRDGREEALLVPEADVDGVGAGVRRGDGPEGGLRIALVRKLRLGGQDPLRNPLDLFSPPFIAALRIAVSGGPFVKSPGEDFEGRGARWKKRLVLQTFV